MRIVKLRYIWLNCWFHIKNWISLRIILKNIFQRRRRKKCFRDYFGTGKRGSCIQRSISRKLLLRFINFDWSLLRNVHPILFRFYLSVHGPWYIWNKSQWNQCEWEITRKIRLNHPNVTKFNDRQSIQKRSLPKYQNSLKKFRRKKDLLQTNLQWREISTNDCIRDNQLPEEIPNYLKRIRQMFK